MKAIESYDGLMVHGHFNNGKRSIPLFHDQEHRKMIQTHLGTQKLEPVYERY